MLVEGVGEFMHVPDEHAAVFTRVRNRLKLIMTTVDTDEALIAWEVLCEEVNTFRERIGESRVDPRNVLMLVAPQVPSLVSALIRHGILDTVERRYHGIQGSC